MSETASSRGEQIIDAVMEQLDPASRRYQALAAARRFKSSWVELGEWLTQVRHHREFEEWGYGDFYDYCAREIRIRKPTAQKLIGAFKFLESHEAELFQRRHEEDTFPDFRSLDLLRQAKESESFTEDDYAGLRQMVVEDRRALPSVAKQFREINERAFTPEAKEEASVKMVLSAARRFRNALSLRSDLPTHWQQIADEAVIELEGRLPNPDTDEPPFEEPPL